MADLSPAEGSLDGRVPAIVAGRNPAAGRSTIAGRAIVAEPSIASWPTGAAGAFVVRHGDGEAVIVARDVHPPRVPVLDPLGPPTVPAPPPVGAVGERPAPGPAAQAGGGDQD